MLSLALVVVSSVVPHAGTWIEIYPDVVLNCVFPVVPHAGTWIEIKQVLHFLNPVESFPTRERGLKFRY